MTKFIPKYLRNLYHDVSVRKWSTKPAEIYAASKWKQHVKPELNDLSVSFNHCRDDGYKPVVFTNYTWYIKSDFYNWFDFQVRNPHKRGWIGSLLTAPIINDHLLETTFLKTPNTLVVCGVDKHIYDKYFY